MSAKREISTVASTLDSTSRGGQGQARPYLFAVLRCDCPSERGKRVALEKVEKVLIGRSVDKGGAKPRGGEIRLAVPDSRLSSKHAHLVRVMGRWVLEDLGSKNGTLLNGAAIRRVFLKDGDVFEAGHTFFVFRSAVPGPPNDEVLPTYQAFDTLNPSLALEFQKIVRIAKLNVPVLIRGETGTGKELLASAIHNLSERPGRFIAVNCAAVPETLAATEFFGHQKGAYSGASQNREGLVRSADHGTLFLDEIGDLPLSVQSILLRVLQENEVLPVGSTVPIPVDIRVCAATHQPIEQRVPSGGFRQDLLGRITGHTLTLPALRQRREDLGVLVANILKKLGASKITFKRKAVRAIFAYRWPQNIRELERYLQLAVGLAEDKVVELDHLPQAVREPQAAAGVASARAPSDVMDQRGAELVRLLVAHQGNVTQIAKVMGKERVQIRRWLKHYHLDPAQYRH